MAGKIPPPPIARALDMSVIEVRTGGRCSRWSRPSGCTTRSARSTAAWPRRSSTPAWAVPSIRPSRRGVGYATTDLQVRYLRSMRAGDGRVLAEGRVVHAGRRTATAEGRLFLERDGTVLLGPRQHGLHDPALSAQVGSEAASRRGRQSASANSDQLGGEELRAGSCGGRGRCRARSALAPGISARLAGRSSAGMTGSRLPQIRSVGAVIDGAPRGAGRARARRSSATARRSPLRPGLASASSRWPRRGPGGRHRCGLRM